MPPLPRGGSALSILFLSSLIFGTFAHQLALISNAALSRTDSVWLVKSDYLTVTLMVVLLHECARSDRRVQMSNLRC